MTVKTNNLILNTCTTIYIQNKGACISPQLVPRKYSYKFLPVCCSRKIQSTKIDNQSKDVQCNKSGIDKK